MEKIGNNDSFEIAKLLKPLFINRICEYNIENYASNLNKFFLIV